MKVKLVQVSQPEPQYLRDLEEEFELEPLSLDGLGPEAILVHIARVSSSRENTLEDYEGLIRYLINNSHWSPFEHTFLTYEIVTSRAIGRQILRHRSGTFQEFSQRYAEAMTMENVEFRLQAEKNRQSSTEGVGLVWMDDSGYVFGETYEGKEEYRKLMIRASDVLDSVYELYGDLLEAGISKETARMVLPGATTTKIYMSAPMRTWIHYFEIRDDSHAQNEVVDIAKAQKDIFIQRFPVTSLALGFV